MGRNSLSAFFFSHMIFFGIALMIMPELASGVSGSMRPILGSALTMGVMTAVILNQLFKIGVSRTAEIELEGYKAALAATTF